MRKGSILNNLQVKVMLLFILVAMVPLFIVYAFSNQIAEDLIKNMVSNQLENAATDKAALLEHWILERKADLQVVADSSILKSMDPGQIAPYLELVGVNYHVYKELIVLSRDGDIIFNNSGKRVDPFVEEWFRHPLTGELYMSDISITPEQQESIFYISAPIFNEKAEVEGVVCATVGTSMILSSIILQLSLGETGECYLVDKNGAFLAHNEPRRILTENIAQSESFKNLFEDAAYKKSYIDYRGIEVLGASRKIKGTDWYLVVEQDRDEAFFGADRLKLYFYIVIIFSMLGAIVLAWSLSYYVVKPIRKLSETANVLAAGKFKDAIVEINRTDEIGSLYDAFRDMAIQLRERQQSLEKKVDLTRGELREADDRLKKTQLAVARSEQLAALGRLGAGVAHEIRTPLTSLKLFLESVRAEIEISPEYEEDFQIAMKQITRIESTINRFLHFARPQEPEFSTINIDQLIEDALLVVGPRANQQETVVDVSIDKDLPKIEGDKKQLGEALINLVVNSLEAVSHRGKLSIAAYIDRCKIDGKMKDSIRVDISDTGPGIKGENKANLFDPFYTTKTSGTGLGLSIVHSTVMMHGGEIWVDSAPDEKTTFSIILPIDKEKVMEEHGKDLNS